MKILILSFFYYPDLSAGSFRTKALTDSFLEIDDEIENITVVTSQPNRYLNYNVEAKNEELNDQKVTEQAITNVDKETGANLEITDAEKNINNKEV